MPSAETPNYDRVGRGLKITQQALAPLAYKELLRAYRNKWWVEGVLLGVSDAQRNALPQVGQTKDMIERLDLAALLNLITRRWNDAFAQALPPEARTYVNELINVRNRWAHSEAQDWPEDDAWRALDTMGRLLASVQPAAAREVEALAKEVRAATYAAPPPPAPVIQTPPTAPAERAPVAAPGAAAAPKPWREVITPHDDVAKGGFQQAEFAADLAQVLSGKAEPEYQDPIEFFQRTFLTEGMRLLLTAAVERLAGKGGEPVVQLKTAFGGGKTHTMLALYHLITNAGKLASMAGLPAIVAAAGVAKLPAAKIAVLAGTDLDPNHAHLDGGGKGVEVRTLWGEMAAQLGGKKAYALVEQADKNGTAPGAATMLKLFDDYGPCVVLIDELVAYARQLYRNEAKLPAGSFDAIMTFVHNLTEAARRSRASMVVASIPESKMEIGAEGGQEALNRIEHTFGRLEAVWKPVGAQEGFEVVRRRLFGPVRDEAAKEAVCLAYTRLYAGNAVDFPGECRQSAYLERLRAAYPIHPEVFDRLYDDWSTLERFQRTRGVLRLMAGVIHALWVRNDRALLIQPGSLPLDVPRVRDELQRYLPEGWNAVIDRDVDGERSEPRKIDEANPRLGQLVAAERLARTIFLGSAPHAIPHAMPPGGGGASSSRPSAGGASSPQHWGAGGAARGIDDARVRLGVAQPGESLAVFNDALNRLTEELAYLYSANKRYWYDTQPNLRREAEDRARRLDPYEVAKEIVARLRNEPASRRGADRVFQAVHWPADRVLDPACGRDARGQLRELLTGADVPDEQAARLVVLPPDAVHARGREESAARQAARKLLESRGNSPRRYRNTLLFLAPDADGMRGLEEDVRRYLAWQSILNERETLNLDRFREREAKDAMARAEQTFDLRLRDTYAWLLVPSQRGAGPWEWAEVRLAAGEGGVLERAAARAKADEDVYTTISPFHLQRALREWLWQDAPQLSLRTFWEQLCTYGYLPRLRDADVLLAGVAEGLRSREYFGYADAVEGGRYRGLTFGQAKQSQALTLDADSVLVQPAAAEAELERRQEEEEARRRREVQPPVPPGAPRGGLGGERPGGEEPRGEQPGGEEGGVQPPARPKVVRRYHGTMALDPLRLSRDVRTIADEILLNLANLPGATVQVTLQIDAEAPEGIPEGVVRAVVENSRTLKLPPPQFERE